MKLNRNHRVVLSYGLAIVATVLISLVRVGLEPYLGEEAPLIAFLLPITLSASLGGLGPGLVATAIGAVLGTRLFVPQYEWHLPAEELRLAIFCAVGVAVSVVSARMHDALRRAHASEEALKEQLQINEAEHKRIEAEREAMLASERAGRSEAEHASRMKDDFVATLSHELRTPLNAILGWVQLLRRPGRGPKDIERGLEVIERNTKLQTQLISDLLDVSRIVSGKLHLDFAPLELSGVIDSALEALRPTAEAKGIDLQKEVASGGPIMIGDSSRLQQVVWNLVSNAIKFTPRGGVVTVKLNTGPKRAELVVSDSGQGIAPEFLPHLFGRFRQADSSAARRHGGLGLGLSIVKQLCEMHGGRVRAESEGLGKGATFTVELPISTDEQTVEGGSNLDGKGEHCFEGFKVLVVDDEADARELVRRVLEERGAAVTTASSAPEALSAFEEIKPDVLVSDIGMPGMDGYALMREICARRTPNAKSLLSAAVTAFARPEDQARALSAGYDLYLTKPLEPLSLVNALLDHVAKHSRRESPV